MFLGEFEHSVDEKGRVAIPARFREELAEGIILTRGFERCLQAFPRPAWERLRERVSGLSLGNEESRLLRRLLFSGAADVEVDRQGRILIPQNLREYAGLAEQVVLAGMDTYFEVWSSERWNNVLETLDNDGSRIAEQLASLGDVMEFKHIPVLLQEVIGGLALGPGAVWADCTLGGGGHALALLEATLPNGRLLGLDADQQALAAAESRLRGALGNDYEQRATLVHTHFDHLSEVATASGFSGFAGVLLDLGLSSYQLDTPQRGFSFTHDGPLDMRLDRSQGPTVAELLQETDEQELANIIYRYGEERASRRIARAIVERRHTAPLQTTNELAALVLRAMGGRRGPIHPATRTFQALRIAVNGELERLEQVLPQAVELLNPGGRLAVISFHSLEDRIVKQFLRDESGYAGGDRPATRPARLRIITRKPLEASDDEVRANPRSRSAKLRIAERL